MYQTSLSSISGMWHSYTSCILWWTFCSVLPMMMMPVHRCLFHWFGQKVCMPWEGWKNFAKAEPVALIPPFFRAMVEDFWEVALWHPYNIYRFLCRKIGERWWDSFFISGQQRNTKIPTCNYLYHCNSYWENTTQNRGADSCDDNEEGSEERKRLGVVIFEIGIGK